MSEIERKKQAYSKLFFYEDGEHNNRIFSVNQKILVFHDFLKLFRKEFATELDFKEFIKEEFNQFKFN